MDPVRMIRQAAKDPVCLKAGALILASVLCFSLVYISDNSRELEKDAQGREVLERNGYGEGEDTRKLRILSGEIDEEIDITVPEQEYGDEELEEVFEESAEKLESLILGENDSLEEVRKDLDLVTEIPDSGITVSWEIDNYDVMDIQGTLQEENLTEEGTLVKLNAVMNYNGEKASHEFYARVFPPRRSSTEKLLKEVEDEVKRSDEETKTEKYLVLPNLMNGRRIQWKYAGDTNAYGILLLGIGAACMVCVGEKKRKKEEQKKRMRQMSIDYPQIINKFNLYIGAGMTVRRAWTLIAEDYERNRQSFGEHAAYEEMLYTLHQIQGGMAEGECYEQYGARCGAGNYRKFGTMLSQNLRKGSKGLTDLLEKEAQESFEERKNLAKKLGEEAGTKLMIPMFMMLAVVFVIVTVPAFFTIQI